MQTLRKIVIAIAIIVVTFAIKTQVYAYSMVDRDTFRTVFSEEKFTISSAENNGLLAIRKNDPKINAEDKYQYNEYNNLQKAKQSIKDIYNSQKNDKSITIKIEEDSLLKENNNNYSILKYNYKLEETNYYVVYYQYENTVISGSSIYKDKSIVDNMMNQIMTINDNKKTTGPEEVNNSDNKVKNNNNNIVKTDKKQSNINSYTYIGLVIILVLIILIGTIIMINKKKKKN